MAGRVLSRKNETALRQALQAIGAVLAALGEEDADGEEGVEETQEADDLQTGGDGTEAGATPTSIEAGELGGPFVPLSEAAVRDNGTALLRIIAPGWGSSGYYPPEVLKRDGPAVFRAGLKGFWDHPTPTEEAERPEGSLGKLASELVSDAQWLDAGPAGPGLYAEAKLFGPYRDAVNELAPHIGVSIRAAGRTKQGEAEGRKGPIVEQLVAARSVDFVTVPGAGGKVIEMFEAARNGVQSRPAAPVSAKEAEGGQMADSKEFDGKLQEAQTQIAALQVANARLAEALVLRDARDAVREQLAGAQVPDVTKARLLEALAANPPVKDGALDRAALAGRVADAVKAEQAYLAEAAGYGSGRITGMGAAPTTEALKPEDVTKALAEAFGACGMSDEEAKIAAKGRGW